MEHIISEIQNPDLDSSLEDIQAMVDNSHLGERVGDAREEDEEHRVSPEFARAAGLLDRVILNLQNYPYAKDANSSIAELSSYLI